MNTTQLSVEEMIKKVEEMNEKGWIAYYSKLSKSALYEEVNLTDALSKNPNELPSLLRNDRTGVITFKRNEETIQYTKVGYDTFIRKE